jgi:hypothetical protein
MVPMLDDTLMHGIVEGLFRLRAFVDAVSWSGKEYHC